MYLYIINLYYLFISVSHLKMSIMRCTSFRLPDIVLVSVILITPFPILAFDFVHCKILDQLLAMSLSQNCCQIVPFEVLTQSVDSLRYCVNLAVELLTYYYLKLFSDHLCIPITSSCDNHVKCCHSYFAFLAMLSSDDLVLTVSA